MKRWPECLIYWQTDGQTNIRTDGLIEKHADGRREGGTVKNMVRQKNAKRQVDKS